MRTLCLLLVSVFATGAPLAAQERTFERTVPATPRGAVTVSNVAGSVKVSGWARNEVAVKGVLEEGVERVDVVSEQGRTVVKVILEKDADHAEAALDIQVPQGSELEVSTVSADVGAQGLAGAQRLKTVSGDIRSNLAQADVEVKTVSGDARLQGRGQPANVRGSTVSGDFTLERGAGALEVTTVSGDVNVELSPARSLRVRTTSGNLGFEGELAKGATIDAESISGDLTLGARGAAGFAYEVSTFSGDVDSCFDGEAERTSRYGPGSRLSGTRGGGAGSVRLKTMSGAVSLCDH